MGLLFDAESYLLNRLVGGYVTHDYPIFPDEAKQIGLPVSTDMPRKYIDSWLFIHNRRGLQ